jgi:hypothetical protein
MIIRIIQKLKSIFNHFSSHRNQSDLESRANAIHEAGHVIARYRLDLPFSIASVKKQEDYSGFVDYPDDFKKEIKKRKANESYSEYMKRGKDFFFRADVEKICGGIAESIFRNKVHIKQNPEGMRSDLGNVVRAIKVNQKFNSIPDEEAQKYFIECKKTARILMEDPINWQTIEARADALLKKEELTQEEAWDIIENQVEKSE